MKVVEEIEAELDSEIESVDPRVRRGLWGIFVVLEWAFWGVFFLFALSVLALRFVILPHIENYKPRIESTLTHALGAPVSIGSIVAGWQGLHPQLDLGDVKVLDASGRAALTLPTVSIAVSWWSVPRAELRLHELDVYGADLDIRRQKDGKFLIGGIELKSGTDEGGSDWILSQRRIIIRDSRLRWNDEARNAPELALGNISLVLENSGSHHRFGLSADPPRALASRLDLRADLSGNTLNQLRSWNGEVYANLAYIDLAAWRAWLDYPADVQAGAGGVRAWAGFKGDRLEHFTADVSLANAAVRLRSDLPLLELARLSGRLSAREIASGGLGIGFLQIGKKTVTGFEVSGKQVALATAAGLMLNPADFSLKTTAAHDKEPQRVEMQANSLDLEILARLVEHLPLDAQVRQALQQYNPRGSVNDFRLAWTGAFSHPQAYTARGRFSNLALDARDQIPGFAGFSGSLDANEKGGSLYLASKGAALQLPAVFEDPKVDLDTLSAQAKWTFPADRLELSLDNIAFSNADLSGTLSGVYRAIPGTPGYVDLRGHLDRADARRVWRYMPLSTGSHTRTWLKGAIDEGGADDVRLTLRGNLRDFPYLNPKTGLFRVTVKTRDIGMVFSEGWPRVEKIRGDLVFEGNSMELHTQNAVTRNAKLTRVDVRIPDLSAHPHLLEVQGAAEGPTSAFLDYVASSPVDRYIDGFTQTLRGNGNGKLAIKLSMPIEDSSKVKITGQYQFINADLKLDEGLPQLAKVNGNVDFNEKGVNFKNFHGEALGGNFALNGGSRDGGAILLNAQGNFTVPGLRSWLNEPAFARASGGAPWRAVLNLKKKAPEITVETNLAGVAIDLPAPLGKAMGEIMPLKVVKTALPARGEDEMNVTLGKVGSVRLQRRPVGDSMVLARGAIGIGDAPPPLPRSGLAVSVEASKIDVDDWKRRLFDAPAPSAGASGVAGGTPARQSAAATLNIASLNLHTDMLSAFGRTLHQVKVSGSVDSGAWNLNVASNEVTGDITYRGGATAAQTSVVARLKNLVVPPGDASQVGNVLDRAPDDLPAIDLTADNFEANNKKFGKLTLLAVNAQRGEWTLKKVALENPDGTLTGDGAWRVHRSGDTRRHIDLKFDLEAHDVGKLLDRLGFTGAVRNGNGSLKGKVGWDGSPLSIDYPSLSGDLKLEVKKGEFLKVDSNASRLLGIMSLQALTQRLTGDFRDIFSKGFAFNEVAANSSIDRGVLTTTDFKMASVSAAALMSGTVDLAHETQNLKLVVLPDLTGGMSSAILVGVGLVNPLVGLGTWLAQFALKGPISKVFSLEYAVTGTWANPKVVQLRTVRGGGKVDGKEGEEEGSETPPQGAAQSAPAGQAVQNPPAGG
ncbi:MAG TPA: YhdP family protein [Burkholderiales bacterium]